MARVARRLWLYLRHDFKEIAWPSSLPDTPEVVAQRVKSKGRRLSPSEVLKARHACCSSGPSLRPH
jgi:hypothetical protein